MVSASSTTELLLSAPGLLPDLGVGWATRLRDENRERFARAGLPAADDETWRFTQLKPLRNTSFTFDPEAIGPPAESVPGLLLPEFVLRNGRAMSERISRAELLVDSLALWIRRGPDALASLLGTLADTARHRFAALNTAHLADGVVVRVSAGKRADLHVLIHGPAALHAAYPRVLVIVEEGGEALLVEEHVGAEGLSCSVTEVHVGQGASLQHVRLDRSSDTAIHLGLVAVKLGRDSRYVSDVVALGARLSRLDLDVSLAGEGAECVLNGIYLPAGRQHMDHHTRVHHDSPHTRSRELYKGVLGGKASAVFNGRIVIREGAMGVDAAQTNNNLLLSGEALVNSNPELEIFADDVKAQHGATIGQLEEEPLFYLRSRGLDEEAARRILIEAFAGEMFRKLGLEPVEQYLHGELARKF